MTPPKGLRALLLLVLVAAVVSGCRTTVRVEIVQDDTGGGTITASVELDSEALEALGGPDVLVFDDLDGTAWEVAKGAEIDDGGYRVQATRPFADATELQAALDELAGPGVFSDVRSDTSRSFAKTEHRLSLDASVAGDLAQFSDEALTETLGGYPVGYTADHLKLLGADQPLAASLEVTLTVPGGEPDQATLDLGSGGAQSASLDSSSEDTDSFVIALGVAGAVAVVIGAAIGVTLLIRRSRARP